jgi:hypothetical protein
MPIDIHFVLSIFALNIVILLSPCLMLATRYMCVYNVSVDIEGKRLCFKSSVKLEVVIYDGKF